ncbi:hypothetical protein DBR17_08985 [Sphingomonas sp. HMWF008]|nr:hypothetical protein DBR17_08985 [Sphingomonas sp. HMWF008]
MSRALRTAAAALLLSTSTLSSAQVAPATAPVVAAPPVTVTVHADKPGQVYDRRIFTQFAEHFGNGIYGGLGVGPNSSIPNTRGFRRGVVAALKGIAVTVIPVRGPIAVRS